MKHPYNTKSKEKSYNRNYVSSRKEFKYYQIVKDIIKILANKNKTILDIGSCGVDLISEYLFKKRVSVSLSGPISNDKVDGYEMDFFDYEIKNKFDIITCCQVVEHVDRAKDFVQKILNSSKVSIISVPYKWEKGKCKYHVQDPVDEEKMYSWTGKKPVFSFYIKDGLWRMICVYGQLNWLEYFKVFYLFLTYKLINFSLQDIFSVTNNPKKTHKIITIFGLKIKIKRSLNLKCK